jgi:regulator of CtrA degradation
MRLTTRLMQVASWLLLQRAVNEGELTPAQAQSEKHRVRLADQNVACPTETFEQLPETLRAFSAKSMRLQARVAHLDRALAEADAGQPAPRGAVAEQFERLKAAFAG